MDPAPAPTASTATSSRAVAILARSLVRDMRAQGYGPEHVVALSSALLELVCGELEATAGLTRPTA